MSKTGIFFGTDTGSTRLVAKKNYGLLGADVADKLKKINRTRIEELLQYNVLIHDAQRCGALCYKIGAAYR